MRGWRGGSLRFVEECRRRQVILPGPSVLERLCADALVAAERRIETRIAAGLDDAMRRQLDCLLTEEVDGGMSRFVWLRRFEVGRNSADINGLLDRLEFLQGFELPSGLLDTVPGHRSCASHRPSSPPGGALLRRGVARHFQRPPSRHPWRLCRGMARRHRRCRSRDP